MQKLEADGATNITVKREQFITPNAAEGLKTFGTINIALNEPNSEPAIISCYYLNENVLQQIILTWPDR